MRCELAVDSLRQRCVSRVLYFTDNNMSLHRMLISTRLFNVNMHAAVEDLGLRRC